MLSQRMTGRSCSIKKRMENISWIYGKPIGLCFRKRGFLRKTFPCRGSAPAAILSFYSPIALLMGRGGIWRRFLEYARIKKESCLQDFLLKRFCFDDIKALCRVCYDLDRGLLLFMRSNKQGLFLYETWQLPQ